MIEYSRRQDSHPLGTSCGLLWTCPDAKQTQHRASRNAEGLPLHKELAALAAWAEHGRRPVQARWRPHGVRGVQTSTKQESPGTDDLSILHHLPLYRLCLARARHIVDLLLLELDRSWLLPNRLFWDWTIFCQSWMV